MILPGATLGVVGGGQLGRMFTVAARTMGYEVAVLDPHGDSPAAQLATRHERAAFDDAAALARFARGCRAITTEFENVPAATLERLAEFCPVRPAAGAVATVQDRMREKLFLREAGLPTAPFATVRSPAELEAALSAVGLPAILKVARLGYDGKGQARVATKAEAQTAWQNLQHEPCVLERLLPLERELSVVLARGVDGATAVYPVAENQHVNGILDMTLVPARIDAALARQATETAIRISQRLEYVGVLAVEFFVADGQLLVNEIAPRPHNSGHYTLDACAVSQFEQQVRTLCELPLGDPRLLSAVVMVNLLGDCWLNGEPAWAKLISQPNVRLHLYGKREPRPGRKMGHYNVLAPSADEALAVAQAVKSALMATPRH